MSDLADQLNGFELEVTAEDFPQGVKNVVLASQADDRILDRAADARTAVIEAMPRVISGRLRRMLPDGFEVAEIALKFVISGTPFGVGIGGDVVVKFVPGPSE